MNQEIKQKWIDALRSGEYQQGRGRLCGSGAFCCLGVLCDLHAQETGNDWIEELYGSDARFYLGQTLSLPYEVTDWANFDSFVYVDYNNKSDSLPYLNDKIKLSFTQIADIIEEQL